MRKSVLMIAAACLLVLGAGAVFFSSGSPSRVVSSIRIHRNISDVFNFFTTPANWPRWHPASLSVKGATDHSLGPGEETAEEIRAGGGVVQAVWRVTAREAPHLWRFEGSPGGNSQVTITYRLQSDGEDTVFERDMQYRFDPLWLRALDPIFVRRHIERESQQALANAKQILEKEGF